MSNLYDEWAGSEPRSEMQHLTYEELLQQVTNLYNRGEEWQQDGQPADVARRLYDEIHSES